MTVTRQDVCVSCGHAGGWHRKRGCAFPECGCGIDGMGDFVPMAKRITRCSVCHRRPDKWGGNHSRGCTRWGRAADAEEGRA